MVHPNRFKCKHLIQPLWKTNISWDEPIAPIAHCRYAPIWSEENFTMDWRAVGFQFILSYPCFISASHVLCLLLFYVSFILKLMLFFFFIIINTCSTSFQISQYNYRVIHLEHTYFSAILENTRAGICSQLPWYHSWHLGQ